MDRHRRSARRPRQRPRRSTCRRRDGMSTATTGAPDSLIRSIARRRRAAARRGSRCRTVRRSRGRRPSLDLRLSAVLRQVSAAIGRRLRSRRRRPDSPNAARRGICAARPRRPPAGPLHQLSTSWPARRRASRRRVQRLEHQASSTRRPRPRARANASSRGRSRGADRSAHACVRPGSLTPGFGRPTISISFHAKRATPKPSALPTASLPAKRPAYAAPGSRASRSTRLRLGEAALPEAGYRASARSIRAISIRSMPTFTRAHFHNGRHGRRVYSRHPLGPRSPLSESSFASRAPAGRAASTHRSPRHASRHSSTSRASASLTPSSRRAAC